MTRLGKRVAAMEEQRPVGCRVGRLWHGVVIADSFGGRSQLDQCPECGCDVSPRQLIFLEGIRWDCV